MTRTSLLFSLTFQKYMNTWCRKNFPCWWSKLAIISIMTKGKRSCEIPPLFTILESEMGLFRFPSELSTSSFLTAISSIILFLIVSLEEFLGRGIPPNDNCDILTLPSSVFFFFVADNLIPFSHAENLFSLFWRPYFAMRKSFFIYVFPFVLVLLSNALLVMSGNSHFFIISSITFFNWIHLLVLWSWLLWKHEYFDWLIP